MNSACFWHWSTVSSEFLLHWSICQISLFSHWILISKSMSRSISNWLTRLLLVSRLRIMLRSWFQVWKCRFPFIRKTVNFLLLFDLWSGFLRRRFQKLARCLCLRFHFSNHLLFIWRDWCSSGLRRYRVLLFSFGRMSDVWNHRSAPIWRRSITLIPFKNG